MLRRLAKTPAVVASVVAIASLVLVACPAEEDRTPTPVAVNCRPNPAPPNPERQPFTLDSPAPNAESTSPLHLEGESSLNDALFRARITTKDGEVLNEVPLWIVSTTEQFLDYEIVAGFDVAARTEACLEVYLETSNDDPTPRDVIQRDVVLLPGAETAGGVCPLNEVPPRSSQDPDLTVETPIYILRGDWDKLTRSASPLPVRGKARVFEGTVSLRLIGPGGRELVATNVQATAGAPDVGDYAADLAFEVERPTAACLQAFTLSPQDGAVENLVQREVLLLP
jgi:hypothetical protein